MIQQLNLFLQHKTVAIPVVPNRTLNYFRTNNHHSVLAKLKTDTEPWDRLHCIQYLLTKAQRTILAMQNQLNISWTINSKLQLTPIQTSETLCQQFLTCFLSRLSHELAIEVLDKFLIFYFYGGLYKIPFIQTELFAYESLVAPFSFLDLVLWPMTNNARLSQKFW